MPRLKTVFAAACALPAVAALALAVLCLSNPHRPLLYLLDIFTLPFLTATALYTALLLGLRLKVAPAIGGVAVLVFLLALGPQACAPQRPADMTHPPIRIMFANLYVKNERPDRLLPWIEKEKPDVVATVENGRYAAQYLTPALKSLYPYKYKRLEAVVYSRFPIIFGHRGTEVFNLDIVELDTPQGPLRLGVSHFCQPKLRNDGCQDWLFRHIRQDLMAPNTILVGDFNSDMSGALMQDMVRATGLRPLAAPVGTWPALLPSVLRINIDNAFAGKAFSLSGRRIGPNDGSDHRPIVFDVRPEKAS